MLDKKNQVKPLWGGNNWSGALKKWGSEQCRCQRKKECQMLKSWGRDGLVFFEEQRRGLVLTGEQIKVRREGSEVKLVSDHVETVKNFILTVLSSRQKL